MSENITLARYGGGYYLQTCYGCGENFEKPILATIFSSGSSRTYYACPRCLTKVGDVKPARHDQSWEKEKASTVVARKKEESGSEEPKCEHFLGYLKKRPKNTPIPDECLICSRMIECLAY